ncbi:SGNH/GDSL hydrolase family protein [Demequina rhizosphaerae]|uniref:SGNH/GDSL hydrolase family protein n=1 Tax=Demequina rhizosphaerae TaxID=1638985 RepID=UPI000780A8CC|nr:SGNH/GDSL hydrolase family protein [Demequina rhizosphaerae]
MTGWGIVIALVVALGVGGAYSMGRAHVTAPGSDPAASHSTVSIPSSEPRHLAPIALFFGDSNTTGVGATMESRRWTTEVAEAMGWREVNYARGGTGYLVSAGVAGCGRSYCANFRGAISEAVRDGVEPDIVVVSGGGNDRGRFHDDPAAVAEAIDDTYRSVHQAFPEAQIVAVEQPWLGDPTEEWKGEFNAAIRASAKVVDATYVPLLADQVLNRNTMDTGDHVHINDRGHQAVADAVVAALTEDEQG